MFSELFKIIVALGDLAAVDYVALARSIGFKGSPDGKSIAKAYIGALVGITLAWILVPMAFIVIGVLLYSKWTIAIAFAVLAVGTTIMFLAATPIGLLVEMAFGLSISGSGRKWTSFFGFIMVSELLMALMLLLFKVTNYASSLPVIVVIAIVLAVFSAIGIGKTKGGKGLTKLLTVTMCIFMLSFIFPRTFDASGTFLTWSDEKMAEAIHKPQLPTGSLTTNQAALNAAVAQAQQTQGQQNQPLSPQAQQTQAASTEPVMFAPGVTVQYVSYVSGQWTTNIVTPPTSKSYRVDIPLHQAIFVKFLDGSVYRMTEEKDSWWGVHRGVFAIMGDNCSGVATVSISYR